MKEQFVTYEIALKLKELGFDEKCFGYYRPMKEWMMEGTKFNFERHFHGCNWANPNNTMYFMYVQNSFGDREASVKNSEFTKAIENIAVPLWQQVIDWLREKHNLCIEIQCPQRELSFYSWTIHKPLTIDSEEFSPTVYEDGFTNDYYKSREQAILKCIELCKNKE